MNEPIDIFIATYLRQFYTEKTISYLKERTNYPYRLIVLDNGGNDEVLSKANDTMFLWVKMNHNTGIHCLWNTALSMAESKYFITSDNDIYVPDLRNIVSPNKPETLTTLTDQPCWLERLVKLMDERPDYGAISLHPHIFIGRDVLDLNDPEDVKEVPHCGAVMRIMRTEAVRKVGGWEHVIRTSRNHEEHTICDKLRTNGYKLGICTRLRAFHAFGIEGKTDYWGYPLGSKPEDHGHKDLWPPLWFYGDMEKYDNNTWIPKML